jgi:hypothetical protein
MSRLVKTFD